MTQSSDAVVAQRAQAALKDSPKAEAQILTADDLTQRITVLDKEYINAELDTLARRHIIKSHQPDFHQQTPVHELSMCGNPNVACTFWWVDLNQDKHSELVLILSMPSEISVLELNQHAIQKVGELHIDTLKKQDLIDAIKNKQVLRRNNPWQMLEIAGQKIKY